MKHLFLLLGLALHTFVVGQRDLEVERLLLKKSHALSEVVTMYSYTIEGERHVGGAKKSYRKFDKKGNTTHLIEYNIEKQGIKHQWFYTYNKTNQVIRAVKKSASDEILEEYKISYNSDGNPIYRIGKGKSDYKITYTYNGRNLVSKKRIENGLEKFNYSYTYNTDGNKIKEEYTDGEKTISKEFVYDIDKNLITELLYKNGELREKSIFEYNERKQKVIEKKLSPHGKLLSTYNYSYNDNGEISTLAHFDHELKYEKNKWVYKYDGNGLLQEIITYDSGDKTPIFAKVYFYKFPKK